MKNIFRVTLCILAKLKVKEEESFIVNKFFLHALHGM